VGYVVGTGYGRYKVTFGDAQITEITCHGRGAQSLFPATRTVIDMGGQDTKAIKVGADGSVIDFSMNDKCAAGTGRFLSAAADVTGVGLDEIGPLSLQAKTPVRLTSVCTVFVESDIMSYLAQRKTVEDILGGVRPSRPDHVAVRRVVGRGDLHRRPPQRQDGPRAGSRARPPIAWRRGPWAPRGRAPALERARGDRRPWPWRS
jgi:predicted CoA-substrate-specific enzyme activase